MGSGDNWVHSPYIYVVYKSIDVDSIIYYSKTPKSRGTTTARDFKYLLSDNPTGLIIKTFTPLGVWASNYTYGVALADTTEISSSDYKHEISNFMNGTILWQDHVLNDAVITDSSGGAVSTSGWMLTSGYTLVAAWKTNIPNANHTVNTTATTLGSIIGPVSFYADVNGAIWIGWTDVDTANSMTYAGYLAKFQGQIYPSEETDVQTQNNLYYFVGIILSTLAVIIAHNLISIWA